MRGSIEVGDTAYYRGLNWLIKTKVFKVYDDKIHLDNGVIRRVDQIGEDVFLDKTSANKTMTDVYKGKLI